MITPTDEQVEAAPLPCPFCGGAKVYHDGNPDLGQEPWPSIWVVCDTCGARSSAEDTVEQATEAWNRRALTAASLTAPAGTVVTTVPGVDGQVMTAAAQMTAAQKRQPEWLWYSDEEDGGVSFGRWPTASGRAPYIRADLASALLPPQPSAALPGKESVGVSLEGIVKDAVTETASRPPGLRGPFVFDEETLQAKAAALVSQPHPEGEAVGDLHVSLDRRGIEAARKAYAKRWMPDDTAEFSSQAAAQVDYIIQAYLEGVSLGQANSPTSATGNISHHQPVHLRRETLPPSYPSQQEG